jgi:hypothetical protein
MILAYCEPMENEDREFLQMPEEEEEEEEYCTVCHTVYVAEEGCWCVEQDAGPDSERSRARTQTYTNYL